MNYAAILALFVTIAFCFPLIVSLAQHFGIKPEHTYMILWSGVIIINILIIIIRWKINLHNSKLEILNIVRKQVKNDPKNSKAYFYENKHLVILLLESGKRREAQEIYHQYSQLSGAKDSIILELHEAITKADAWRFTKEEEKDKKIKQ